MHHAFETQIASLPTTPNQQHSNTVETANSPKQQENDTLQTQSKQSTYRGRVSQVATQDELEIALTGQYEGTHAIRKKDIIYIEVCISSLPFRHKLI
jgi:hypothetical protein